MRSLDPAIATVPIAAGTRLPGAEPVTSIPPANTASGNGGNASTPHSAAAVALAATLSGLIEGTLLEALVLGHAADGGTVLKTPNGTFVTAPAAAIPLPPLAPHAKVLLEVLAVHDLLQARLVAVDNRSLPAPAPLILRLIALAARQPEPPASLRRAPADAAPTEAARPATAPPVPVRPGQTLLAVLQPAPHPIVPQAAPQPVPSPFAAISRAPFAAPPLAAAAAAAAAVPRPTLAAAPALIAGAQVSLRIVAAVPPGAAPPAPLPPGVLIGEVEIEGGPDHERLVLRLPGASLRLPPNTTVAPGTRLAVEVLASAPPPGASREPEAERLVAQLQAALIAHVPADAAQAARLAERVPTPGRKLTAAALLFLAAARQGDLAGWLDAALPQAAHAEDEPLKRLGAAWRQLASEAEAQRRDTDAWHPLVLPFYDGVALRPLTFQLRRRPAANAGESGETRFLLDLDLSAIGTLQLDGLIRARRFDLMLRGAARLDRTMRHELSLLFQESLGAFGFSGTLAFRDERPTAAVATHHVEARA